MPAPSCPHDSMKSTVGGQGRMLGERGALGRHAGSGGWGRCIGPATARSSARGDPDARSPVCAGAGLVARFTQEARAAASLSHPNIVAIFDSGSEAGMHDLVIEYVEAQSAATAPTSRCRSSTARRQGRRAGRRARQGPRQAGPAGRRRLPPGHGARRPRRRLTVLTGRAAPARVGATVLRNPVTRAVRWLTRFHGWTARTQHPLELLASQMRRAVAEAAKS
jgi:hypothetical protein